MNQFKNMEIYKVSHSRKGTFTIQVTNENEEWVTGTIIEGKADALLDYNQKFEGEEITLRKSFLSKIKKVEPDSEMSL